MPGENERAPRPLTRRRFLERALKAFGLVLGMGVSGGTPLVMNQALETKPPEPDLSHSVSGAGKPPEDSDAKNNPDLLEVPVVKSGAAERGGNRHVSGASLTEPISPEDHANGGKINPSTGDVYVER